MKAHLFNMCVCLRACVRARMCVCQDHSRTSRNRFIELFVIHAYFQNKSFFLRLFMIN